jgi:hypothetical protein
MMPFVSRIVPGHAYGLFFIKNSIEGAQPLLLPGQILIGLILKTAPYLSFYMEKII